MPTNATMTTWEPIDPLDISLLDRKNWGRLDCTTTVEFLLGSWRRSVVERLPNPGPFTVLIRENPVGTITVTERYPRKVFGRFTAAPAFEPYRSVFEEAVEVARQFDATPASEPCDYLLWDKLMAAYGKINELEPSLTELPSPIEEFAVDGDWGVEITFKAGVE